MFARYKTGFRRTQAAELPFKHLGLHDFVAGSSRERIIQILQALLAGLQISPWGLRRRIANFTAILQAGDPPLHLRVTLTLGTPLPRFITVLRLTCGEAKTTGRIAADAYRRPIGRNLQPTFVTHRAKSLRRLGSSLDLPTRARPPIRNVAAGRRSRHRDSSTEAPIHRRVRFNGRQMAFSACLGASARYCGGGSASTPHFKSTHRAEISQLTTPAVQCSAR